MSDAGSNKDRILDAMHRIETAVHASHPEDLSGLSQGQQVVLGLHIRCMALFHGIQLLLQERLGVEAQQLFRTLVEDAILIRYIREHNDQLESLTLSYLREAICQEIGLFEGFIERGISPDSYRRQVNERNAELEELKREQERLGIAKLPRLPKPDERLRDVGHGQTQFAVDLADKFVHTSRIALGHYFRESEEGSGRYILSLESEMSLVMWTGWLSIAIFGIANIATAQLLSWDTLPDLERLSEETAQEMMALMEEVGVRFEEPSS